MEPETPVVFRWDDGEVTAVFPTEVWDHVGRLMGCYAHRGQHSGCDYGWYRSTRPATEAEYAPLKAELEAKPYEYRLKVYKRITRGHRDDYMAELRRTRAAALALSKLIAKE